VTDRESIVLFVHVFMRSGIQSPYLSHGTYLTSREQELEKNRKEKRKGKRKRRKHKLIT
jgi:hypothetical protein